MAKDWKYTEDRHHIVIDPPKQTLKISGHRIAAILGLDKYKSPFQVWCECTKILKQPFEENKYIIAGRVIEPKIIQYVSEKFPNIKSIEEFYGNNFEDYRYNNFKDESDIFGGVMDCVSTDNSGKKIIMICECKTSSKPQEWSNASVPVSYLLQGALYAYLKGLDRILFACSFLSNEDYGHPENFVVSPDNTILVVKKLKDMVFEIDNQLLNIEDIMKLAENWWNAFVKTGISPSFDEKDSRDKEYLNILRESKPCEDNNLIDVINEVKQLEEQINTIKKDTNLDVLEKKLKTMKDNVRDKMIEDDICCIDCYKLVTSISSILDKEKLEKELPNVYKKYINEKVSYKLMKIKEKEKED